jgi:hypothetical protein
MTRALIFSLPIACALASACGPDADAGAALTFSLPQALLSCASVPELSARMWVSGSSDPCALDVDVQAGTTSGTCDVTPGTERTLTLDWTTVVDHAGEDFTLLLAQARGTLDLSTPKEKATFTVGEDDVVTTACRDMRTDTLEGAEVIDVDGVEVPPCDVDESCDGDDGACTNLGELCASADPFDPTVEPL